jgi:8-oxo-dGTP pyrophosphatase MutT (NUDIX family)
MPEGRFTVTCTGSRADSASMEHVRRILGTHRRKSLPTGPVPAAVLLPLFCRDGAWQVLFTKRTDRLNHHSGEISFPGGVRHPEDPDLLTTALRESMEEVGIAPADVEVLGALDDIFSVYDYLVTPFVGVIPCDYRFTVNADEIERLIVVPVAHLLRPEIYRVEDWSWKGREMPVPFFSCGDDEVWGLTATILRQFLDLVFRG